MQTTLFPDYTDLRYKIFIKTELGQLYQGIPFGELAALFREFKNFHPQGVKSIFSIEGGIALQFLKHYLNLSDAKLIARVNVDWQLQMFCGVKIRDITPVMDEDIVGRWRKFLGMHGNCEQMEDILLRHWKGHMKQTHVRMDDATVFESYIKFPTDQKLLWDSIAWVWKQTLELCRKSKVAKPRFRYDWHCQKQVAFAKRKRKTRRLRRSRSSQLIRALDFVLDKLQGVLNKGQLVVRHVKEGFFDRLRPVKKILAQQLYHHKYPQKPVPHRIVSLYKPYIRPIVRGKENKAVEFGAKVHLSQVDGINLIEHFSFEAFHEGNRMWKSVYKHQKQFGTLSQYGADQIYASNANRKILRKKGITHCFKKKGKDKKATAQQDSQMRSALGKARATRVEGSFGNEKNHYLLSKVKARTQETEVIWIFFGIHTPNALLIGRRMAPLKASRGKPENTQQAA